MTNLAQSDYQARLEKRLAAAAARMLRRDLARGALFVAGAVGLVAMGVFAADRLTLFPAVLRFVVTAALLVALVSSVYVKLIVPLVRKPGPVEAARALEAAFPQLGDFCLSAAELAVAPTPRSSAPSAEFVRMTVEEASARAARLQIARAVPMRPLAGPLAAAALAVVMWGAALAVFPEDCAAFAARFADPFAAVYDPTRTRITLVSAPRVLPKEATFTANAVVRGLMPDEAAFRIVPEGGRGRTIYASGKAGRYTLTLERVTDSFSFLVEAGDARSGPYPVRVVERPAVVSLRAEAAYPAYTGVGKVTLAGGNVKALAGSAAVLFASFNKPVRVAWLALEGGGAIRCVLAGDGKSAEFAFDVSRPFKYKVALIDEYGIVDTETAVYSVTPEPDAAPVVTLSRPSRDLTAVPAAVIPIEAAATDDYGVTAVGIRYALKRAGAPARDGDLLLCAQDPPVRGASASSKWDLSALALSPGDELTYSVFALDNVPGAPQAGASPARTVRIVSVAAKVAEIQELNRQLQANLNTLRRKQAEVRDSVAALTQSGEARQ